MSPLRQALLDYLAVRRALGYKLERDEKLIAQFLAHLEDLGEKRLTAESALAWATLPTGADRSWWSSRLSIVRGFAAHLRTIDPETEVPPADLLPWRRCRATPYLYSDEEVAAIIAATAMLCTPHRVATYRTLIGLLVVTGMRVGEAIGLDRGDFDSINGLVIVRKGKFGKSRELPLHRSSVDALRQYLRRRDRPRSAASRPAVFVSTAGTRLLYTNVQCTFHQLVCRAGLKPRSASCRPRLHDIRHGFAVRTFLEAYRDGCDAGARLPLLSTYLGHVDPGATYWYLSAAPELLELAAARLQRHLGGDS
jgi:integrase